MDTTLNTETQEGIHKIPNIIKNDEINEMKLLKNILAFMNKLEKSHMDILVQKVKENDVNPSNTNAKTNTKIDK